MTGKKKGGQPAPSSHGYVSEHERHTERITLRLPPETMALLREAAFNNEMGVGAYVTALLTTMVEHPGVPGGCLLEDLRGPWGDEPPLRSTER